MECLESDAARTKQDILSPIDFDEDFDSVTAWRTEWSFLYWVSLSVPFVAVFQFWIFFAFPVHRNSSTYSFSR